MESWARALVLSHASAAGANSSTAQIGKRDVKSETGGGSAVTAVACEATVPV